MKFLKGSGSGTIFLFFHITFSAKRLIGILFSQHHKFFIMDDPVRIMGKVAAVHTDCMDLGHVFCGCHQCRHRTEGFSQVIDVKAGNAIPERRMPGVIRACDGRCLSALRLLNSIAPALPHSDDSTWRIPLRQDSKQERDLPKKRAKKMKYYRRGATFFCGIAAFRLSSKRECDPHALEELQRRSRA